MKRTTQTDARISTEADRNACETLANINRRRQHRERLQRLEDEKDRLRNDLISQAPDTATVRDLAAAFIAGDDELERGHGFRRALEIAQSKLKEVAA